jgi:DNA-directed RNA polymerase specialized sigma24 family protein
LGPWSPSRSVGHGTPDLHAPGNGENRPLYQGVEQRLSDLSSLLGELANLLAARHPWASRQELIDDAIQSSFAALLEIPHQQTNGIRDLRSYLYASAHHHLLNLHHRVPPARLPEDVPVVDGVEEVLFRLDLGRFEDLLPTSRKRIIFRLLRAGFTRDEIALCLAPPNSVATVKREVAWLRRRLLSFLAIDEPETGV